MNLARAMALAQGLSPCFDHLAQHHHQRCLRVLKLLPGDRTRFRLRQNHDFGYDVPSISGRSHHRSPLRMEF